MLFVTYLEVNEDIRPDERRAMAESLTLTGEFPPAGVDIVRWENSSDGRTVAIIEAREEQDVRNALAVWRAAAPAFFRRITVNRAHPVLDTIRATGYRESDASPIPRILFPCDREEHTRPEKDKILK